MVWNPLTVAWPNGNTAVPSSRFALSVNLQCVMTLLTLGSGLSLPQPYDEAEHTLMRGTISNSTHWTVVARCRGCTGYQGNDGERTSINGSGIVTFAWARGTQDVSEPANNGTSFGAHQDFGKWQHNLKDAQNTNFDEWVAANSLAPVATSSSTAPTSTSSAPAPPSTTVVTSSTPSSTVRATIPASCSGAGNPAFQNALATGWKATKVLGGLQSPRQIVFDNLGNMLVVQSGKGISVHAMGADGCVTSTKTLISLNSLNHGLQLSADGNTLYASSMTQVYSWPYTASTQTLGTRATIVTGMFNGGAHVTRTLQLVPGKPNLILVSHGSNANLDMDSARASTGRAIIKAFDMSAIPSGGYNYVSQGYVVAYGLRNEVGMTMDNNNKFVFARHVYSLN